MHVHSSHNSFGQLFLVDLGPRSSPDRAAWAALNALRSSPHCLVDHVFTPVHVPGARATPDDHRFGEVILNESPTPATIQSIRRAYTPVRGARLHI